MMRIATMSLWFWGASLLSHSVSYVQACPVNAVVKFNDTGLTFTEEAVSICLYSN